MCEEFLEYLYLTSPANIETTIFFNFPKDKLLIQKISFYLNCKQKIKEKNNIESIKLKANLRMLKWF